MQIDMVMWAKNGAKMLPTVLKRVEKVVPNEVVGKRIFVDDHSTDETPVIAKDFGWSLYLNKKGGVGSGASLALNHVTAEYFMSIEQDVILAKDWFEKVPKHLERKDVAVAQGWRISNHPVVGKIDKYTMQRFRHSLRSIDNTIYKTKIIRAVGGFPEHLKYTGVDAHIHQSVLNTGLQWITDSSVISIHLRMGGLREQIRRYYFYGMDMPVLQEEETVDISVKSGLARTMAVALFSPFRGFEIAVKQHCPQTVYYYPFIRLSHFTGYLKRRFT